MEETLNTIKKRYIHERSIYTWCGIALVAVNPYQEQDIYGDQVVETYHSASHSVYLQLDPHIYAVTEDAYSKLERNLKNQSIIVSGESGAGKTVSAKHAMRYLASIASSKTKLRIENRVLASNPIMEAIGNASTVRNDNSSRFGKYIQIFFDRHQRKILGANMRTYLLEKSRVTKQQSGERNFHIFYQLLNYAYQNPQKTAHLKLVDLEAENQMRKFKFLAGLEPHSSRDDLRKFNEALKTLNIDEKRTDMIYRIVAGILHGGNIEFTPIRGDDDDNEGADDDDCACTLDVDNFHFQACCQLIGLDPLETRKCLTTKLLRSGSVDIIEQKQNRRKAEYSRDAMLKYIYECLFTWLVALINLSLSSKDLQQLQTATTTNSGGGGGDEQQSASLAAGTTTATAGAASTPTTTILNNLLGLASTPKSPSAKKSILDQLQQEPQFIGVLDIYGFENFKTNSFEQFCINYANEVLQQQYNQHVFKIEQEEYIREGIDWTFIEYSDNQPVIDVIETRPIGILNLLDEECRMPKGTDKSWCAKLYDQLLPSPGPSSSLSRKKRQQQQEEQQSTLNYDRPAPFKRPKLNFQNSFTICHYAEEVDYTVDTFLEKNRDTIAEEQSDLLRRSEVIAYIFNDPLLPASVRPKAKTGRSATVGWQFRGSLAALIKTLNATEPHYIRCIKPNDNKKAFEFNEERAVQQLKACGVYETIRISNNGFPSRWLYKDFAKRYCVLIYGTPIFEILLSESSKTIGSKLNTTGRPHSLAIQDGTTQLSNGDGESLSEGEDIDDDDDEERAASEVNNNDIASNGRDQEEENNEDEAEETHQKAQLKHRHFMCQFSAADIRPICEAICRIAYHEETYKHWRSVEEQKYLDKLIERHGDKPSAIYQFGQTKIFFRAGQVGYLERVRGQRLREFTVTIQRHVRGWLARKAFILRREQYFLEQQREASLVSLQNQVASLQAEQEQKIEEEKEERIVKEVSRLGSLYQLVVDMMYVSIQPLIISALLEYEALDSPEPFSSLEEGGRSMTPSSDENPMEQLIKELDRYHDLMKKNSVPEDISIQAFKQIFYLICAQSLNQLLIRRDLCQFGKAMQINFNLSCLVQWCREHYLVHWRDIIEQLDPITQATKLLQTRKSSEDIATIGEVCNKLRPSQIIKILNMYTSSYEEQITIDFIHELEEYLRNNNRGCANWEGSLFMDSTQMEPVQLIN